MMDLVEIRRKAKSRKPKKEKSGGKTGKKAAKSTSVEDKHRPTAEKPGHGDNVDPPEETVASEEMVPIDDEGSVPSAVPEEIPGALESLDAVLKSQREEVKEDEEEQLQLLTFTLGGEEYALNIMDIKEIIRPRDVTEVPKTPDYIQGIFSLRGTIIPVFDVRLRLGLPQSESGPLSRIVVVKFQEHFFGLLVDKVVQVLDIPISKIEPPPEILGGVEGEFLRGIGRIDERLIILLNLGRILKLDDSGGSGHLELPTG